MLTKVHGAVGYARLGFSYVNDRMGGIGDRRATLFVAAFRSCLNG